MFLQVLEDLRWRKLRVLLFEPPHFLHKELRLCPVGKKHLHPVPEKPYRRSEQGDAPSVELPLLEVDRKQFLR